MREILGVRARKVDRRQLSLGGLFLVIFFLISTDGLADTIIPGLRPFGEWLLAFREADDVDDSASRVVGPFDSVELRGKSSKKITVEVGEPDACDGGAGAWSNGRKFAQALRPRVQISFLARTRSISIREDGAAAKILNLCEGGDPIVDVGHGVRWGTVSKLFADVGYEAVLIRNPALRVFPGDEVSVAVFWQMGIGDEDDGLIPYVFSQLQSAVDHEGRIFVPILSSPLELPDNNSNDRRWEAINNNELSYITVWKRGAAYQDQPILQEIEACIAAGSQFVDLAKSCDLAWADDRIFASTTAVSHLRLHFEARQKWFIAFDNGSRVERPYIAGQAMGDAISRAHLEQFGSILKGNSGEPYERKYVVVLPRVELGGDASTPFWAELTAENYKNLNSISLLPGDVVRISRVRPRSP